MRHLVVAAAFEDVGEADDVALDVGMRILQRVADAGLGGQVDHLVEFLGGEQGLHAWAVGDIELDEAEVGMAGQAGQAALLERHFVVVVKVVEADNLIAAGQQAQGGGHADKTGGAGDENFHELIPGE